jgi:hypothetical protein
MILIGCDLHTRKQQLALLNTDTGELRDQELSHVGDDVERFYAALPPPVTVGIESTGYSLCLAASSRRRLQAWRSSDWRPASGVGTSALKVAGTPPAWR